MELPQLDGLSYIEFWLDKFEFQMLIVGPTISGDGNVLFRYDLQ